MLALGTKAPPFELPEPLTGHCVASSDIAGGKVTLVAFLCNHCPYVQHVLDGFVALARDYRERGVAVVAINSNDVESYPDDGPDEMARLARERDLPFPFLLDGDQSVARAYRAACTPDFFVFDREGRLAYRGQMDGSRPANDVPVDGRDLRAALDALLAGDRPSPEQQPSMGCNIKWKAGHEPS